MKGGARLIWSEAAKNERIAADAALSVVALVTSALDFLYCSLQIIITKSGRSLNPPGNAHFRPISIPLHVCELNFYFDAFKCFNNTWIWISDNALFNRLGIARRFPRPRLFSPLLLLSDFKLLSNTPKLLFFHLKHKFK